MPLKAPLIVMALQEESQGLIEATGLEVIYSGVGKVNAAYTLTKRLSTGGVSHVINIGSAGSSRFERGALVAASACVQRDMDAVELGFAIGQTPFDDVPIQLACDGLFGALPRGICGSGDSFVSTPPPIACDMVDMEAYALAAVCRSERVPFSCAKYITDGADGAAAGDWSEQLVHVAQTLVELCERYVVPLSSVKASG